MQARTAGYPGRPNRLRLAGQKGHGILIAPCIDPINGALSITELTAWPTRGEQLAIKVFEPVSSPVIEKPQRRRSETPSGRRSAHLQREPLPAASSIGPGTGRRGVLCDSKNLVLAGAMAPKARCHSLPLAGCFLQPGRFTPEELGGLLLVLDSVARATAFRYQDRMDPAQPAEPRTQARRSRKSADSQSGNSG